LTGNEVGVLLGADLLQHADTGERPKLVITTIVSSTMLGRIAADMDASYAETLTGFKWLATTAIGRERDHNEAFVFGYEEALGYSAGPLVRDKDGVSAAVRLAELAAWLKGSGQTLLDELDRLALCHGQSSGLQWSVRLEGRAGRERIDALMSRLRERPLESLAGAPVVRRYDVLAGCGWSSDGEVAAWDLPAANVLVFFDAQGTRLVVRPSGTEPKIKFYLESVGWPTRRSELEEIGDELGARLARIRDVLMEHLSLA
jgi:phosphomannomutase